jgi:hypothetical protein
VPKNFTREFPFIGSDRLEQYLDIRKSQRLELRAKLPSPLYWYQFPDGRKIFWNWVLVRDYLLNGGNRPEHQRLIEEYLESLEPAKTAKTPKARAAA